MFWLLPNPSSPVTKLSLFPSVSAELTDGKGWGRGGAKSYDCENAWSSINHKLSDVDCGLNYIFLWMRSIRCWWELAEWLHCKKRFTVQGSPNSPWPGLIKLFPQRETLVSDIPAGDGKTANLFYSVDRLTANGWFAPILGSIPASSDTVESEGRQMKQCWIKYRKNKKNLFRLSYPRSKLTSTTLITCIFLYPCHGLYMGPE